MIKAETWNRINDTKIDMYDTFFVWNVPDSLPESDECLLQVHEYGHHESTAISGKFYLRAGTNKIASLQPIVKYFAGVEEFHAFSLNGRLLGQSIIAESMKKAKASAPGMNIIRTRSKNNDRGHSVFLQF